MNKSMVVFNISNKNNITSIVVLGDCAPLHLSAVGFSPLSHSLATLLYLTFFNSKSRDNSMRHQRPDIFCT